MCRRASRAQESASNVRHRAEYPPRTRLVAFRCFARTLRPPSAVDRMNRSLEAAARRRPYADDPAQSVGGVVDDVQHYFHDAFVSTTWPLCPFHRNHPLWLSDEWWRCDRIEEPIARLGALSGVNQEREG
jgi:hypothetical protein